MVNREKARAIEPLFHLGICFSLRVVYAHTGSRILVVLCPVRVGGHDHRSSGRSKTVNVWLLCRCQVFDTTTPSQGAADRASHVIG